MTPGSDTFGGADRVPRNRILAAPRAESGRPEGLPANGLPEGLQRLTGQGSRSDRASDAEGALDL